MPASQQRNTIKFSPAGRRLERVFVSGREVVIDENHNIEKPKSLKWDTKRQKHLQNIIFNL